MSSLLEHQAQLTADAVYDKFREDRLERIAALALQDTLSGLVANTQLYSALTAQCDADQARVRAAVADDAVGFAEALIVKLDERKR